MRLITTAILIIVTATAVRAQDTVDAGASVNGQVIDKSTGLPLSGAHVAIASSLRGTVTDGEGRYSLPGITPGAIRLIFSMIGFETAAVDTVLSSKTRMEIDIPMTPRVIELGDVSISGERPRRWTSRLRQFERLFLGESDLAEKSSIENAEVLEFGTGIARLTASASAPLVIENRGLGYRLTYHLREFERSAGKVRWDGDPLFEELEPVNDDERARWPVERCRAFFGSFRHFVLTLIEGGAWDEGFRLSTRHNLDPTNHTMPFRASEHRLIHPTDSEETRELRWSGYLEVEYVRAPESDAYLRWERRGIHARPATQRSWIRVSRRPAIVDIEGEVADPYALTLYGYFAFTRIADMLPKEYRPPEHIRHPRDCASIRFARYDANHQDSKGMNSDLSDIVSRSIVHSTVK
jgi:hypothetical protein